MAIPMDVNVRSDQYSAIVLSVVPRIFNWFKEPVTLSNPVAKIMTYVLFVNIVLMALKVGLAYVCFHKFVFRLDAVLLYLFDRICIHVNDVYVVLVNHFVESHFETVALCAKWMRLDIRSKDFLLLWIFYSGPH